MKRLVDPYKPLAEKWGKDIRHPTVRFGIACFCLLAGLSLLSWVARVWLKYPSYDVKGLLILAVPVLGAFTLFYMIYLFLFAPMQRLRLGLLSPRGLMLAGVGLIGLGIAGLTRGWWEAAFLIAVGITCFTLARERRKLKDQRTDWL